MIRGNKLNGFLERIEFEHKPITADIFLTGYCNNKCYYCRYSKRSGKYISYNDFVKYIERLKEIGVRSVILTGGGEPTINPDFEKICQYLNDIGMPYGINTNMNIMVFPKPVFLKVSLDYGNKKDYKLNRGKYTFNTVIENINKYYNWKNSFSKNTVLGVQCVAETLHQVQDFYNTVKNINVDYIQFRPIEKKGGYASNNKYNEILHFIENLNDERVKSSFKFKMLDYRPKECIANWSVIAINVNGDVPYCCHRPDEIIGNIMDFNILKKIQSYKVNMDLCEIPCRLSGANQYMENYKKENDAFFI